MPDRILKQEVGYRHDMAFEWEQCDGMSESQHNNFLGEYIHGGITVSAAL